MLSRKDKGLVRVRKVALNAQFEWYRGIVKHSVSKEGKSSRFEAFFVFSEIKLLPSPSLLNFTISIFGGFYHGKQIKRDRRASCRTS